MSIKKWPKQKLYSLIIITFLIFAGTVALFWGTWEKSSDVSYCSSCHMMKPEYYTWKESSHNQLQCVQCHVEPGTMTKVKYKLFSVKEWYAALSGDYGVLIQSTKPIPDASCNVCHDMTKRVVTPSGDLIIPHSKHAEQGIGCTTCHTGIAHGNIAEKRATFRTDYGKWDELTGKSFMSDVKNLRPNMKVCMDCHKVRSAPLTCNACHRTSMEPENHKTDPFKNGGHGDLANQDIKYCDSCHSYMSKVKVDVSKGNDSTVMQFLFKGTGKQALMPVGEYAKLNTYCRDCHRKRPPTHDENFATKHSVRAAVNKEICFTCHEDKAKSDNPVTSVMCSKCHPSVHYRNNWRPGHPIALPDKPKVTEYCYTCHNEKVCSKCHVTGKKVVP